MKKILLTLAALSAILPAASAQQRADTLVVNRPDKVTVITSSEAQEIRIQGSAEDPDYTYFGSIALSPDAAIAVQEGGPVLFGFDIFKWRKKESPAPAAKRKPSRYSTTGFERFDLGFTETLSAPSDLKPSTRFCSDLGASFFNFRFRPFRTVLEFSTSLDLGYRAVAVSGGRQFVLEDGVVDVWPMDGSFRKQKSSLRYNYVGIPVYMSFLLGNRHNRLAFGVAGHYNFNGRIRDRYIPSNGEKFSYKTAGVPVEKLSWEYILRLDLDAFGAYVKYSPCPVLAKDAGPSFNTLSFGLSLNVPEW